MASSEKEPAAMLVTREEELREVVSRLKRARRIGLDIESNGLFKFKATLCTIQLAAQGEVVVIDAPAVALGSLSELLGPDGPPKIVHDVAFDARLLAESGLVLANVLDTSIAARMLGRTATGLASLLGAELAGRCRLESLHHETLVVAVEDPAIAEHLRWSSREVIDAANAVCGGEVVRELQVRIRTRRG